MSITTDQLAKMFPGQLTAKAPVRQREMNKTERAYQGVLESRKHTGEVAGFCFESITFILAHDLRYTVDFFVQLPDGTLECHEVKGFFRDDAKVKIKMAARMFPFRFVLVTKDKEGWHYTEIKG